MNPTFRSLHQAHAAALDAYTREDLWSDGVREALRALLAFLGAQPDYAHQYLVELRYVPGGEQHLDAAREAFTSFLTPGHDAAPDLPLLTAELITGGVLHLMTRHALEGRVDELPATLAELTCLVLAPYLPAEEVRRAVLQC
jgi:hypothetical protein